MLAETAFITKIIKHPPMKQPTSAADIKFSYSWNRQKNLTYCLGKQVCRIKNIEKPFHKFIDFRIFAPFAVIHCNDRNWENNAHLQNAVRLINGEEIYQRVQSNIENHPRHLLAKIASVSTDCHNTKSGNTTPITRQSNNANQNNEQNFIYWFNSFAVGNSEHYQTPGKWTHNARLI